MRKIREVNSIFYKQQHHTLHGERKGAKVNIRQFETVENGDEIIIPEIMEQIINAEENCVNGVCALPETQHLQIRVSLIFVKKFFLLQLNTQIL